MRQSIINACYAIMRAIVVILRHSLFDAMPAIMPCLHHGDHQQPPHLGAY